MNRIARILFLVSLISAADLATISQNTHALPQSSGRPITQTGGGGNVQAPRSGGALTDGVPINFDIDNFIDDFSGLVQKEIAAGKVPNAIGRELEISQAERGVTEKSGSVLFLGDHRSGRTTVVKAVTAKRADFQVWRLKLDVLYKMDTKAEQSQAMKNVILGLEQRAKDNPHAKTILYVDNLWALNQGASVEIRPVNALVEALAFASGHGLSMYLEVDGPTNREVFLNNRSVYDRLTVDELKPAKFDAVVYHLRKIKPDIERTYGVIIHDSTLAETARLSVRFYNNNPFDAGESLLRNAAHRTIEELKGNTTEAMRAHSELVQLEAEKQSIEGDIANDPTGQYEETPGLYQKRLKEIQAKIMAVRRKSTTLIRSDPTLSAQIENLRRDISEKKERLEELEGRRRRNAAITREYNQIDADIQTNTARIRDLQLAEKEIRESGVRPSRLVTLRQVQIVTSEFLKIPLSVLSVNIEEALRSLTAIKGRVIGQDHIIDQAAVTISAKRQERKRAEEIARQRGEEYFAKPIWSAMLAGSTGTGKTEISKQIAKQLGIPESDILRFDMNEFQEQHSISRLIGSPPGYVGYDEGGKLTNGVLEREYRVILFDEIEKAHPKIFDALMAMLDEGHLTDSQGRKVRFGNTIILFTTNLGQEYTTLNRSALFMLAKKRMGELDVTLQELKNMGETDLRLALFKGDARARWGHPQVARIDDMLMTNNHTPEAIATIVRNLVKQLMSDYDQFDKVKLYFTDTVLQVIEANYKVSGGARIVKSAFKNYITDPLNIMAMNLQPGDAVTIDFANGMMDYIVTSQKNHARAVKEAKDGIAERRRLLCKEIMENPGGVGRANRELQASGYSRRAFDETFQVRDATVEALKKYRK